MDFVYSIHHYSRMVFIWSYSAFFSKKTSFSQNEVEIKKYPVISIIFVGYKASEVNLTNVEILYHTKGLKGYHELQTGENHLHNERCNKTEII